MKARKDFVCPTWKESWKWKWKETYISGSAHTFFRRSIWYYLAVRQIRKTECPIGKNWALIWQKLSVDLAKAERLFGRSWALIWQKLSVDLPKAVCNFGQSCASIQSENNFERKLLSLSPCLSLHSERSRKT